MLEDDFGGVRLEVLGVCDDLHDAIPDFVTDVVPSGADQLQDGVDIPLVRVGVLLRKDSDLEHHLFAKRVVCYPEIS